MTLNKSIIIKGQLTGGGKLMKTVTISLLAITAVFSIGCGGKRNEKDSQSWTPISWNELSGRWGQVVKSFDTSPSNPVHKAEISCFAPPPSDLPDVSTSSDSLDDILDGLGLEVSEGRRYGVCDIFKIHSAETDESVHVVHVIDCVDNQETLSGDYHIAVACYKYGRNRNPVCGYVAKNR